VSGDRLSDLECEAMALVATAPLDAVKIIAALWEKVEQLEAEVGKKRGLRLQDGELGHSVFYRGVRRARDNEVCPVCRRTYAEVSQGQELRFERGSSRRGAQDAA
jgi:hypothetical protein